MEVRQDLADILLDGWPAAERDRVFDRIADHDRATLRGLRAQDGAEDSAVQRIVARPAG
jgi:hypothetical protein